MKRAQESSTYLRQFPILLLTLAGAAAQTVNPGGIVNVAGYEPPVAPGSVIMITGANLAGATLSASSVPLPTTLAGATVLINGRPAPLFYVSPTQINAQLPFETAPGTASIVVNGSPAVSFPVEASAPGILMYGNNRAVVVNQDGTLNTPDRPTLSGGWVTIYMSGQGPVSPSVATGAAAPSSPLALPMLPVTASIGGHAADVLFAGLTPGGVGLFQVNLRIPDMSSGDYPLVITIGQASSNAPLIAVSTTGGPVASIVRTIAYHQITSLPDAAVYRTSYAISGNGAVIAYSRDAGPNQIYTMNFDGSGQRMIDSYKALCFCGSIIDISDNGSKIVYTEGRQIRLVDRGAVQSLLVTDDNAAGHSAGISGLKIEGDGARVFFLVDRDTTISGGPKPVPLQRGLYVMNFDGSGMRQIVGPNQIAALFGMTASSYYIPSFTDTGNAANRTLSVSADGNRIVFAAHGNNVEGIFGVNRDGSGLHFIIGPVPYVFHVAISGDGTKVLYVDRSSGAPVDTGVVNFDGSGLLRLRQDGIGETPGVSLTADGSVVLAYDILYNTDGSGVLQLGTLLNWFTMSSPASGRAVMNSTATRFVYPWVPPRAFSQGFSQLVSAEINPKSLGAAPVLSSPSVNPAYAVAGGAAATVTVGVAPHDRMKGINYALVRDGLVEDPVNADIGLTDTGNGTFRSTNVIAKSTAPPGPRLLRLFAWVSDAGGLQHGTLVDVAPFSVVLQPPASGSPVINVSPASLDFGAVAAGQSKDLAVTVSNTGGGSAAITAAGSSGAFTAAPASFTLSAGAQQAVTIRFRPADSTPQTATITFSTADPSVQSAAVAVKGSTASSPAAVVITSDTFDRADAGQNSLGLTDLGLGGNTTYCYVPVWSGAGISSRALQNNGSGAGGVQFGQPGSGGSCSFRGVDMGQNMNISVDVLAPGDSSGNSSLAGPYFRNRGAAAADGILGGDSGGYWVRLDSSGVVTVMDAHLAAIVASSARPESFDNSVFHTLEVAVNGGTLQVALDRAVVQFTASGASTATVAIPATGGSNNGTAGVAFGLAPNSGRVAGARADNLVVTAYRSLSGS